MARGLLFPQGKVIEARGLLQRPFVVCERIGANMDMKPGIDNGSFGYCWLSLAIRDLEVEALVTMQADGE